MASQYRNRLEQFAVDVIYNRRKGKRVFLFASLLNVLSLIFTGIVKLRLMLYEKRFFRSHPLGCTVVVVGNLTVGGTGKTPVVEKLAKTLTERGRNVAILSRGYKSKGEPFYKHFLRWMLHIDEPPPKVVSDGNSVLLDSEMAGDEPYMLAKNLPGVVVLVDKNRVKAGRYAIRHFGTDTLILDDGYQYMPLKGRLNLLLIDKTNPFGNECLLPRGILREPISHLRRSSCIFLTKSNGHRDLALEAKIRRYKPKAEIIECCHNPQFLQEVNGDRRLSLSRLKGARIAALSGIAMPESFEQFLRSYGAELLYVKRFLDHHRFSPEEFEAFIQQSRVVGADFAVTTEKDAVRISQKADLPLYFLRMEIHILEGQESFEKAIDRVCFAKQS